VAKLKPGGCSLASLRVLAHRPRQHRVSRGDRVSPRFIRSTLREGRRCASRARSVRPRCPGGSRARWASSAAPVRLSGSCPAGWRRGSACPGPAARH